MTDDSPAQTFFFAIHQLLVAVDLSPLSLHAFRWASELARRAQAEVTAVHIVPPMPGSFEQILFPYAALGSDRHDIEAELLDAAKVQLLAATDPIRSQVGAEKEEIYAQLFHGPVLPRLKGAITETSTDLLFCGAFGETAPTAGQLGGVTQRLLATAIRPTFVVRSSDQRVPGLKKVLVAFDGSPAAGPLLNWAISFALWFDADVEVASVVPAPYQDDPCSLFTQGQAELPSRVERGATTRFKELLLRAREALYVPFPRAAQAQGLSLRHHVVVADPLKGLLSVVESEDIDLVVFATRHPSKGSLARLGRVADGLARLAGCHTLTIPVELLMQGASEG